jgi:hypothetical protein
MSDSLLKLDGSPKYVRLPCPSYLYSRTSFDGTFSPRVLRIPMAQATSFTHSNVALQIVDSPCGPPRYFRPSLPC